MADASRDGKSLDRTTITDLLDAVLDDYMPLADFEDWLAGSASACSAQGSYIGMLTRTIMLNALAHVFACCPRIREEHT